MALSCSLAYLPFAAKQEPQALRQLSQWHRTVVEGTPLSSYWILRQRQEPLTSAVLGGVTFGVSATPGIDTLAHAPKVLLSTLRHCTVAISRLEFPSSKIFDPTEARRQCNRYICQLFLVFAVVAVLLLPISTYQTDH